MVLGIIIAVLVIISLMLVMYYNKFISLKNSAEESFSGIDVQLKRRYDLVPNIVETVKGYAKHEASTFESIVKARNAVHTAENINDKIKSENMLTGALKSLFALSENYPELKANENFRELQDTLNNIEDNIQAARRYYNAVVRDYNTLCESFPSVIIARVFNFSKKEFFESEEKERENVKVSFN